MRLTVTIGREKIVVPGDASRSVAWLISEISWRYASMYPHKDRLIVRELRTYMNGRLHINDQLIDVLKDGDQLIAITGKTIDNNNDDEVKPGDMVLHYHLLELIGEGTYGLVFKGKDTNLNRYYYHCFITHVHSYVR